MYREIEHDYSKEELDYILALIPKIRDMDFNISNRLMITNPQKEIFNINRKPITLKTDNKEYMTISPLNSIEYIENKNIVIISINYTFVDNLDLIEQLLLKEI